MVVSGAEGVVAHGAWYESLLIALRESRRRALRNDAKGDGPLVYCEWELNALKRVSWVGKTLVLRMREKTSREL